MERAKERVRDTEVKESKTRSKQVAKLCLMFQALISAVLQGQLIYPNCLYLLFRMFYFSIFFPTKILIFHLQAWPLILRMACIYMYTGLKLIWFGGDHICVLVGNIAQTLTDL